jgi:hypothetical protein
MDIGEVGSVDTDSLLIHSFLALQHSLTFFLFFFPREFEFSQAIPSRMIDA